MKNTLSPLRLLPEIRRVLRQWSRRPGINALAIASIALGIGVNSSIFSLVNAVLLRDPPVRDPGKLVEIYTSDSSGFQYGTSSYPDYLDLRQDATLLEGLAAYSLFIATYDDGAKTRLLFGEAVSSNFFDLLGVRPVLGRSLSATEAESALGSHPVVLLGYGFWQREFAGNTEILGSSLKLNGQTFTIVGVAPELYAGTFPALVADYWIPLQMYDKVAESPRLERRGARSFFLKGRLAEGASMEQVQAQMDNLAAGLGEEHSDTNEGRGITLVSSREVAFNPGVDGQLFGVAGLLLAVVGLVLLIACSNIANLLLARASDRRREIAVRQALGAGRGQLLRQLMLESLLLALVGGALGLLLALLLSRLAVQFQPPLPFPLAVDLGLDLRVVGFTLLLALGTGLLSGLAPAIKASRPDLVSALRDESGSIGRGYRRLGLRNLLVVIQVAVSTVLLLGAGLFLRSLASAQAIDPGFDLRQGVVASLALGLGGSYSEAEGRLFLERVEERVEALPGVSSAALAESLPLGFSVRLRGIDIEGAAAKEDDDWPQVDFTKVGPGYFETMGIAVPWGRSFSPQDDSGAPGVVIVNEEAAKRFWPGESALGKTLRFDTDEPYLEVIGVARTGKYRTLGEEPRPFVYQPYRQSYTSFMSLIVAGQGNEAQLLRTIRQELEVMDPDLPLFDIRTITDHLAIMLFPARVGAVLLAAFGLLGLVLASVGLYGVVAYSVARRTREVGIRMAIGAHRRDVLRLVVREGMTLVVFGLALGLALAVAAGRLLGRWLYGIEPTDLLTFTAVPLLLLGVALVANLVPARRATRIDPMVALRHD
ncbi:MAG: ABC transporter permease [Deltaproteobacteria bacterium]|nr:ABC transporter permease [Deltaproteobacteria bacterium]